MDNQIRDVWADNLEVEMANLRNAVERYPYVAMVSIAGHGRGVCAPSTH